MARATPPFHLAVPRRHADLMHPGAANRPPRHPGPPRGDQASQSIPRLQRSIPSGFKNRSLGFPAQIQIEARASKKCTRLWRLAEASGNGRAKCGERPLQHSANTPAGLVQDFPRTPSRLARESAVHHFPDRFRIWLQAHKCWTLSFRLSPFDSAWGPLVGWGVGTKGGAHL